MKKLRRFALNDARILSREEMLSVEGNGSINWVDICTTQTPGAVCLYSSSTKGEHTVMEFGVCAVREEHLGGNMYAKFAYCV